MYIPIVDTEYYINEFRMSEPLIPPERFPFFERSAVDYIFERRRNNTVEIDLDKPPEFLKRCVCKCAELIFENDNAPKAGEIISETDAGYSYRVAEEKRQKDADKELSDTIRMAFRNTEFFNDWCSAVMM